MSEVELLEQTAAQIFADHCSNDRIEAAAITGWDEQLWRTLENSGLTQLSVIDGTLHDAAAVVRVGASYSAPVPIVETILGGWLLARLGLDVRPGALTAALSTSRVAHGRHAPAVLVVDGQACVATTVISRGTNLAREPRDEMSLEGAEVIGSVTDPAIAQQFMELAAILRTVQLAGAAERALALTVGYVQEREAFGRRISAFQAVQQEVAKMAAETALIRTCADAAVDTHVHGGAVIGVAAAKAAASRSAGIVARIAHQMHGAIGFTFEHELRHSTTRLWSWRDEAGAESFWSAQVATHVRNAGGSGLWRLIAGL